MLATLFATALALTDLSGQALAPLPEDEHRLVVFWASWCSDCREKLTTDLPAFDARPDVRVVAINIDADPAKARAFVASNGVTLPVYREPAKALQKRHKVFAVPYWIVLRRGTSEVAAEGAGYDLDQIKRALEAP